MGRVDYADWDTGVLPDQRVKIKRFSSKSGTSSAEEAELVPDFEENRLIFTLWSGNTPVSQST